MGMEVAIEYVGDGPSWEAIHDRLRVKGMAVQIRMIDGLPAFPDEIPEPGWQELRLSTANGMITLRNRANQLFVVVWGNADPALLQDRDQLAAVCTELTTGQKTEN